MPQTDTLVKFYSCYKINILITIYNVVCGVSQPAWAKECDSHKTTGRWGHKWFVPS